MNDFITLNYIPSFYKTFLNNIWINILQFLEFFQTYSKLLMIFCKKKKKMSDFRGSKLFQTFFWQNVIWYILMFFSYAKQFFDFDI